MKCERDISIKIDKAMLSGGKMAFRLSPALNVEVPLQIYSLTTGNIVALLASSEQETTTRVGKTGVISAV